MARPELLMTLPRTIADVLSDHVVLPRKTGYPAQPHERRADYNLRRAHPGHVDGRGGQCQGPHHDQADQPEGATVSQQEAGVAVSAMRKKIIAWSRRCSRPRQAALQLRRWYSALTPNKALVLAA